MAYGFRFSHRASGGAPTIKPVLAQDTATYTKGDWVNLETGELDLGATGDTNLLGVVQNTISATDSTTLVEVITDSDAIYAVDDANARVLGATLDLTGATGAQTVTTSSNKNFVVAAASTASEPTLVRLNVGKGHENTAL